MKIQCSFKKINQTLLEEQGMLEILLFFYRVFANDVAAAKITSPGIVDLLPSEQWPAEQ